MVVTEGKRTAKLACQLMLVSYHKTLLYDFIVTSSGCFDLAVRCHIPAIPDSDQAEEDHPRVRSFGILGNAYERRDGT